MNFIFWLLFLSLPNIAWIFSSHDQLDAALRALPVFILFFAALTAWIQRPRHVIGLAVPFIFLVPAETAYILEYREPSSSHILGVISESSFSEAVDFLGWSTVLIPVALGLLITGLAIRTIHTLPARLPQHRAWLWLRVMSLVAITFIGWYALESRAHAPDSSLSSESAEDIEALFLNISIPTETTYGVSFPVGVPFRIMSFLEERLRLQQVSDRLHRVAVPDVKVPTMTARQLFVLIIGESNRPDHWSINGYHRLTTPQLSDQASLVSLTNVVTPWSSTRRAVPILLTGSMDAAHMAKMDAPSVLALFKKAGFRTSWLSNQAPLGPHDSMISVLARQADTVLYTNGTAYKNPGNFDEALIDPFQQLLRTRAHQQLVVIHLLGSHKRYIDRYPTSFEHFTPTDKYGSDAPEALVNAYDNSIRYTDYVLTELIKKISILENTQAAVLYVSDHGQTLPKNGCTSSGHGRTNEPDLRVSAFIWFSKQLVIEKPELLQRIRERQNEAFFLPEAAHTLMDIANLSYEGQSRQSSWVSLNWKSQSRWAATHPNFDNSKREGPCQALIN